MNERERGKKRRERGKEKKREWMEQKWETNAVHKTTLLENDVEGRKKIDFLLSLSSFSLSLSSSLFLIPSFVHLREREFFFKCFMFLFKHGTKRIQVEKM